jgi:hypothetical protein
MFTRRQAIRWAELWLSCWNDGDFDTLLAMHRDDARFGVWDGESAAGARLERKEAMKRHWAAVPFGLHSVPAELDEIAWDPESREITVVFAAEFAGTRVRGCDLISLDSGGRVIAGETCMGAVTEYAQPLMQPHSRDWVLAESAGGR